MSEYQRKQSAIWPTCSSWAELKDLPLPNSSLSSRPLNFVFPIFCPLSQATASLPPSPSKKSPDKRAVNLLLQTFNLDTFRGRWGYGSGGVREFLFVADLDWYPAQVVSTPLLWGGDYCLCCSNKKMEREVAWPKGAEMKQYTKEVQYILFLNISLKFGVGKQ